jgi:predicted DNA binding CopG/RHH family protein
MGMVKIPKFKNETDEADWLYKNREGLAAAFLKAAQEGRVREGTLKQHGATPPTTIRLAPEDISRARTLADRRGLRYQTYLKMLIHEALEREEKASLRLLLSDEKNTK